MCLKFILILLSLSISQCVLSQIDPKILEQQALEQNQINMLFNGNEFGKDDNFTLHNKEFITKQLKLILKDFQELKKF